MFLMTRFALSLGACAAFALSLTPAFAGETRNYVVSWFYFATFSTDADCIGGINHQSARR
jgi:hypothetical protein